MIETEKYLILPGCDDTNRGDQALVWETVRIAQDAGYCGDYYMLANESGSIQSQKRGIQRVNLLLPHPSEKIANKNNIKYGAKLKLRWTLSSISDFVISLFLLNKITRFLIKPMLVKKKTSLLIFDQAAAAFVKGGGFLHAYGGVVDAYKIYFFLFHILYALALKKPVYIMPNSFGPFNDPISRLLIRYVIRRCRFVSVRESISAKYLENLSKVKIFKTNDLAVYLQADIKIDINALMLKQGIDLVNRKSVAITVRPYRFPEGNNLQKLYKNYISAIIDLINWLIKQGLYPVLIEHVHSVNLHEQDMKCIQDIHSRLTEGFKCPIFSERELNSTEMKALYSRFDYIVGTRFHSVIFSMMETVPAIAITYGGNKGIGIMKDLGLEDFMIDICNVSGPQLIKKFELLINNEDRIRTILASFKIKAEKDRCELITKIRR